MSWDVSIIKFSRSYASIEEISDDETPHPIGTQNHVHAAVARHVPGTDWNDNAWGIFESPHGSIDFNLGRDDSATIMMIQTWIFLP